MTTLFDLPSSPEEFGVVLPSPDLRNIDFSGLDYSTARRAIIEYIKTYHPDQFNDFVASNGYMMLVEIISACTAKLSLRADMLANESIYATAKSERAIVNHIALLGQKLKRQTAALVDVEITVDNPIFTDLHISPGLKFSINGPDNKKIFYEIYRAHGDWFGDIIIPANKRGVIVIGIEGQFATPTTVTSPGGTNQQYTIEDEGILDSPISATVTIGGISEEWLVIPGPIEKYNAADKVVEVNFINDSAIFRFGDNVTGAAPQAGSSIEFKYRTGGGIRGRIGVGQIDESRQIIPNAPANAAVSVRFRNITASDGGRDRESVSDAKKRAPRDFSLQGSIVTGSDYAQATNSYSHPTYGTVNKSVATIKTGKNANLVEIYILADGSDNIPVVPNIGLKTGLSTYINDLNVLTDHISILDGAVKPIDIEMNVIINRSADASIIKERVEAAITDFFDSNNWDMGQPFYQSNFVRAIESIDGVLYIDVIKPINNILVTNEIATANSVGVGYNELIIAGNRTINYFYEKTLRK